MKEVLVLCFTNLHNDARVIRQINFLKEEFKLTVAGFSKPPIDDIEFVVLKKEKNHFYRKKDMLQRLLGFYNITCKRSRLAKFVYNQFINKDFDYIIANDIDTLPVALEIKRKAKVIFDAHEYYPENLDSDLLWRIFSKRYMHYLCKRFACEADSMLTVNDEIADKYKQEFELSATVITNAPKYYNDVRPQDTINKVRLAHHGYAQPERKIEDMIKMMEFLDERYEFHLYLVKSDRSKYYDYICDLARNTEKVLLHEAIPVENIVLTLNNYDIGVYLLNPISFNFMNALPNKFFDFVQARLCIAISPNPSMKRYVENYSLGVVSEDFTVESLAKAIRSLSIKDIMYHKEQSHKWAKELSADRNKEKLLQIMNAL